MTTFLKGDTTAAITLALADGFDYSGKTVNLEYQGVRRTFTGCVAGGALTFAFAAEETAPMSLGAYPVRVWIEGGGEVLTVHNADVKLRVTDCIADVHGGGAIYLDVHGGLHGIEGLPERFTDEDLRSKVNEIVQRLGGAVAITVLALLPAFGSTVEVLTAPKGAIYNDQPVVTNVTVDVNDKADKTNTYTKAETDARIVELSPPTDLTPATNYANRALGAFASTGTVARTQSVGNDAYWQDATGCVWRVWRHGAWTVTHTPPLSGSDHFDGPEYVTDATASSIGDYFTGEGWYISSSTITYERIGGDEIEEFTRVWIGDDGEYTTHAVRAISTNVIGRVALTNDIPVVPAWAKASIKPSYSWGEITDKPDIVTPTDVTAAIREHSLCGIWDDKLGVWWTPHMSGGAYYWTATTNVNLSAEGNQ